MRARGFLAPETRRIVAGQILFALAALAVGIATLWFSLWPTAFAAGSFLAAGNLYCLGKGVDTSIFAGAKAHAKASAGIAMLHVLLFWFRFVVTGFMLYVFLVPLAFPPLPLLAGLSTVVASLSFMGFSRVAGKL